MREVPKILVIICTCGGKLTEAIEKQKIVHQLQTDPLVQRVEFFEQTCTADGWEDLVNLVKKSQPNRILIGACLPYVYKRKLKELGRQIGLDPALIDLVDINSQGRGLKSEEADRELFFRNFVATLESGIAKLKWVDPEPVLTIPITQKALVIGGGIAGMTAALAIADHGFEVDLVESAEDLGGNLSWLAQTLDGHSPKELLEETVTSVNKHPKIRVHIKSRVVHCRGEVGNFHTTIEDSQNGLQALKHAVTIFATGATEAATSSYGYGTSPAILTQKELEQKLSNHTLDPAQLSSVVMIQCVDSREEPRNYCSRLCCAGALKHALHLKEENPDLRIYILYRDMMSYGFYETYYTQARKADVMFIQYHVDEKPQVEAGQKGVKIMTRDPLIGRAIQIEADLLVLATGVVPTLSPDLAEAYGSTVDALEKLRERRGCCSPTRN